MFSADENSVAKLFEEVKVMFNAPPSRIENRVDPEFRRRKRKFHPVMFEEMLRMGMESRDSLLGFLMVISMFKDEYPWVYEVGVDTYRTLKSVKSMPQRKKAISSFERVIEMTGHPIMREFQEKSDESYYLLKEVRHLARHYLDHYADADYNGDQSEQ